MKRISLALLLSLLFVLPTFAQEAEDGQEAVVEEPVAVEEPVIAEEQPAESVAEDVPIVEETVVDAPLPCSPVETLATAPAGIPNQFLNQPITVNGVVSNEARKINDGDPASTWVGTKILPATHNDNIFESIVITPSTAKTLIEHSIRLPYEGGSVYIGKSLDAKVWYHDGTQWKLLLDGRNNVNFLYCGGPALNPAYACTAKWPTVSQINSSLTIRAWKLDIYGMRINGVAQSRATISELEAR